MSKSERRAADGRSSFVTYVLEQLSGLHGLGCRAMFGGFGLYLGRTFFGIVFDDRLYFRTHGDTVADYVRRGMLPFRPNDKHVLKNYYEVPADVLESRRELSSWAAAAARPADEGAERFVRGAGKG
jgi:DNA transformation protein